ncbi:glucose 1-dehydrogenase [Aestuariibacter halophilus]|uniref:Glucose 1-dehydrogenase n=1 Tax=Fluctibacter halophilus TaxID=226011 RepID=A0ABS8G5J2_9ALTE|nr:glucose 1-dehydrogenase [Aestuariibacter halophilus]MCC2615386.1 glucose 1-dehydrogenase [Aestuariibacter halophilus]
MSAADVSAKGILITGAASGIGAASARVLAERGARVFLGDIDAAGGAQVVEAIRAAGGQAEFRQLDVTDPVAVNDFVEAAVAHLGSVQVALNNAGIDHAPGPMHLVSQQDYDRNIAVNLTGVWHCMRAELGHMLSQGGGHIINLASVAGVKGAPSIAAYGAAKHGVIGLTKSAAVEYAKASIRINAVCPSFVDTPMVQNTLAKLDEKQQRHITHANPMKRLGHVDEIAKAIAWLCSDESSFMTGQSVVLDGGLTA